MVPKPRIPKKAAPNYEVHIDTSPIAFNLMRDLKAAGLKILDSQSGREFHALINLPCYGLTRKTLPAKGNTHHFGFANYNQTNLLPKDPKADTLIDRQEAPYDLEAALFLHGQANWLIEAKFDSCWVLIVTDTIDIDKYTKLISPIVANYSVDLIVSSLLGSFEDGVRIDLTTVTNENGSSFSSAIGGDEILPTEYDEEN